MTSPKNLPVFASARDSVFLILLIFALAGLHGGVVVGASAPADGLTVTEDGLVSADIVNLPLGHVLADFSQKLYIDVKGKFDGDERVTLHFSSLTLSEALRRIMADYNYVLIEPEQPGGGPLTMTVLGKVGSAVREAAAPSARAVNGPDASATAGSGAALAASASPASSPTTTGAPPEVQPPAAPLPNEGALPAIVTNPPASADAAAMPPSVAAAPPPGILPAPEEQPEFNPAAWGGRGRRGLK
jgi:hypothetical protein